MGNSEIFYEFKDFFTIKFFSNFFLAVLGRPKTHYFLNDRFKTLNKNLQLAELVPTSSLYDSVQRSN